MNQWYTPQDHNTDESQNNYAKWKKPDPFTKKKKKKNTFHVILFTQNCRKIKINR